MKYKENKYMILSIILAMSVSVAFNLFVLSYISNLAIRTILNLLSGWFFGLIAAKLAINSLGHKITFKEILINHKYLFQIFKKR